MRHVNVAPRQETMRQVKIIHEPGKPYPYGAVDTQTGAIALRMHDREMLIALCHRLGWKVSVEFAKSDIGNTPRPAHG